MITRRLLVGLTPLLCFGVAYAAPEVESRTPRKISSAESYISTSTLSAAITRDYSFAGLLVVDAGFDVPDAALRARIERMKPRMTDALRTALANYTQTRYRAGTAPDPEMISAMLQQAADRIIGGPGAKLLLSNVMVQRGR
jgi:hypothetical protein